MNHGIDQNTQGSSGADAESPSITEILGSKAVLPGESIDEYRKARRLIIKELVAKSPMQLYLARRCWMGSGGCAATRARSSSSSLMRWLISLWAVFPER